MLILLRLFFFYIDKLYYKPFTGTVTLTFGEVAESHVGMQKLDICQKRVFLYMIYS